MAMYVPSTQMFQTLVSESHPGGQCFSARHRNARHNSLSIWTEEGLFVAQNDPLSFWMQPRFGLIADLARDLLAAPASQAFVEQIFFVCRMLIHGRHNRMWHSLKMRVCLKLSSWVLGLLADKWLVSSLWWHCCLCGLKFELTMIGQWQCCIWSLIRLSANCNKT